FVLKSRRWAKSADVLPRLRVGLVHPKHKQLLVCKQCHCPACRVALAGPPGRVRDKKPRRSLPSSWSSALACISHQWSAWPEEIRVSLNSNVSPRLTDLISSRTSACSRPRF